LHRRLLSRHESAGKECAPWVCCCPKSPGWWMAS
jgi:hypothetical protein